MASPKPHAWRILLGSGCNGFVKLAVRNGGGARNDQQKYAVKAFKLANVVGDQRASLEAEVEIFLSMDHPHIARLIIRPPRSNNGALRR